MAGVDLLPPGIEMFMFLHILLIYSSFMSHAILPHRLVIIRISILSTINFVLSFCLSCIYWCRHIIIIISNWWLFHLSIHLRFSFRISECLDFVFPTNSLSFLHAFESGELGGVLYISRVERQIIVTANFQENGTTHDLEPLPGTLLKAIKIPPFLAVTGHSTGESYYNFTLKFLRGVSNNR